MLQRHLHEVLGVELRLINEQHFSCRYCLVSKNKNLLHIALSRVVEGNLSAILAALPKKYPLALTLTGKGVINKNCELTKGAAFDQVFHHTFPAIDQAGFYVQQFSQQQNALLSIARKPLVDELLDKFGRAGLNLFSLSLGAAVTVPIWAQLNCYGQTIQFDGHAFTLGPEKEFLAYRFDPLHVQTFPLKVAETEIDQVQVLAYATAFQLLLHEQSGLVQADVTAVNASFANFVANGKLKAKTMVCLFGLLASLIVSLLLFAHYNDQNAELLARVGVQTANAEQTDLMLKNIAVNEAALKQLNWNGGYNYGFLLNEIGATTPKQVQLQRIEMNEFKTEKEKLERLPDIRIAGTTTNLTALNNWIFVLKEKPWVKTVSLLKYQEDDVAGQYQFNVHLVY